MINNAGFTLSGVYHYFEIASENDETVTPLYEDIELFEGGEFYDQQIEAIDKDLVIDQIIEDYGDLFVLRQIPNRFKRISDNFFKKNYKNFAKMQIALQLDFNPMFNYDRYETWSDNKNYNSEIGKDGEDATTITGSETDILDNSGYKEKTKVPESTTKLSNLSENSNGTHYHGVSADNAGSNGVTTPGNYAPATYDVDTITPTKTEVTQGSNAGETSFEGQSLSIHRYGINGTGTDTRRDITEYGSTESHTGNDLNEHEGHMYGNIGVTTSTQMIKEVLELYDFDIYKFIADKYAKELLLKVY